jgi:hypothetical protein
VLLLLVQLCLCQSLPVGNKSHLLDQPSWITLAELCHGPTGRKRSFDKCDLLQLLEVHSGSLGGVQALEGFHTDIQVLTRLVACMLVLGWSWKFRVLDQAAVQVDSC